MPEPPEAPDRIWAGRTQTMVGGKPLEGSYRHWWTEALPPGVTGTAYVIETPARAAAEQILEALKYIGQQHVISGHVYWSDELAETLRAAIAAAQGGSDDPS